MNNSNSINKKPKKIMTVFGTRPEAIKMCPLIRELKSRKGLSVSVCVTAQHREMLDGVLETFGVTPDFDLNVMRDGQTLPELTERVLHGLSRIFAQEAPDAVLVHGDTTSAFAAALAAFYQKLPVGHVEAGLRTRNLLAPFPEEFNRQAVGLVARWHFAPTEIAKNNLLCEGKDPDKIFVTGNTVTDALKFTLNSSFTHPALREGKRLILLTAHRRENLGEPMRNIFTAVREITDRFADVSLLCPLHKNPEARRIAIEELGGHKQITLCEPLDTAECHNLLSRCYLALTDSGGIQEEATALGIPTLVLRDSTERPEGVKAGILKLVGHDKEIIRHELEALLEDPKKRNEMAKSHAVYGDGNASRAIADILENQL